MCISVPAWGQTDEELEKARGWFQEALALEVAGDFPSALIKLQQVSRVRLTPQVRYHLARCKENLGRLTEALGDYRVAATEAKVLELPELEEFDRALLALESRVPKLRVAVTRGTGSRGAYVELDGVRLGDAALEEPIPVDPGPRRIVLLDSLGLLESIDTVAVEGKTVVVALTAERRVTAPPKAALPHVSAKAPTWAYVSAGISAGFVTSSIALFVIRANAISELESSCNSQHECSRSFRGTYERGKFASWAAPTALGIGGAALGVAVWGFWPGHRDRKVGGRTPRMAKFDIAAERQYMGVRFFSEF